MEPIEIRMTPLGNALGYLMTFGNLVVFGFFAYSNDPFMSWITAAFILFGLLFAFMAYRSSVRHGVYMKLDDQGIWHVDRGEYVAWENVESYSRFLNNFRYTLLIFTKRPVEWRQPESVLDIEAFLVKIIPGLKPMSKSAEFAGYDIVPFSNYSYAQIAKILESRGVKLHG